MEWNDDFKFILAADLNLSDGFIEQVLAFLLERSLLESKLFLSDTVLTSPGIQRRFQLAVKERAKKTPVKVEGFWLLDEEMTEPFIQVQLQAGNSVKNEDNSRKNVDSSQEKSLKESKEKKSKEKEIKVNNGHVNEVATQIETAKSYFRHVPLVPQDSKTTISANSKSKEAYGYAQQGIELLGQTLDGDVHNIRSLNLSFSQFDEMMGKLAQHGTRYPVIKAADD